MSRYEEINVDIWRRMKCQLPRKKTDLAYIPVVSSNDKIKKKKSYHENILILIRFNACTGFLF